jgi:hypothetical protein
MGATRSKREVKSFPKFLGMAAVCLTTTLAFGQDRAKPAGQLEWVVAKWRPAPVRRH